MAVVVLRVHLIDRVHRQVLVEIHGVVERVRDGLLERRQSVLAVLGLLLRGRRPCEMVARFVSSESAHGELIVIRRIVDTVVEEIQTGGTVTVAVRLLMLRLPSRV